MPRSKWFCFCGVDPRIGVPVNRSDSSFDSNAVFPQKIKIAAELRAENGIRIEFGIAARCSSDGPYLAPPVFKILFGNHSIDPPFSYAQPNLITGPNRPQRTAFRRLWETCRIIVPNAVALMRASVMRTMS